MLKVNNVVFKRKTKEFCLINIHYSFTIHQVIWLHNLRLFDIIKLINRFKTQLVKLIISESIRWTEWNEHLMTLIQWHRETHLIQHKQIILNVDDNLTFNPIAIRIVILIPFHFTTKFRFTLLHLVIHSIFSFIQSCHPFNLASFKFHLITIDPLQTYPWSIQEKTSLKWISLRLN